MHTGAMRRQHDPSEGHSRTGVHIEQLADRYRKGDKTLTPTQRRRVIEHWRKGWEAMPQTALTRAVLESMAIGERRS